MLSTTSRRMFVWQLLLAIISVAIFACIPVDRERDRHFSPQSRSAFHPLAKGVPVGARMCDRLLFGMQHDRSGRPTRGGDDYRKRANYTRELAEKRVEDYRVSNGRGR